MIDLYSKRNFVGAIAFVALFSMSFVAVSRNQPEIVPIIDSLEKCEQAAHALLIADAAEKKLPRPTLEQSIRQKDGTTLAIYRRPGGGSFHVTATLNLGRCEGDISNLGHYYFAASGTAVMESSSK